MPNVVFTILEILHDNPAVMRKSAGTTRMWKALEGIAAGDVL